MPNTKKYNRKNKKITKKDKRSYKRKYRKTKKNRRKRKSLKGGSALQIRKARAKQAKTKEKQYKAQNRREKKKFIINSFLLVLVMGQGITQVSANITRTQPQNTTQLIQRSNNTDLNPTNSTLSLPLSNSDISTLVTHNASSWPGTNITIGSNNYNIQEVWVIACSGNTCRSPALKLAGNVTGFDIETCGTSTDNPGSRATPASLVALESQPSKHKILSAHRSSACDPTAEMFLKPIVNKDGKPVQKVFGVVAQKNADDLLRTYDEIFAGHPEQSQNSPKIVVLGDVVPACKPMQDDPWYRSKANVCPDGDCTVGQLQDESEAYDQLHIDANICIQGLIDYQNKGGPVLSLQNN